MQQMENSGLQKVMSWQQRNESISRTSWTTGLAQPQVWTAVNRACLYQNHIQRVQRLVTGGHANRVLRFVKGWNHSYKLRLTCCSRVNSSCLGMVLPKLGIPTLGPGKSALTPQAWYIASDNNSIGPPFSERSVAASYYRNFMANE